MSLQPTVLCRGPVHEGFATPAVHTRHRGDAIAETPPEPLVEKLPGYSERDNTVTWLPGYWARDTQAREFVWVSGCWRRAPPAQRWLAGYWHENEEGHAWIPGAWVDAGQEVTFLPPPPEPSSEALAASTASADQFVVPGSWQYESGKYRWRPAFSSALRDGWVWIPAHYTRDRPLVRDRQGSQFVPRSASSLLSVESTTGPSARTRAVARLFQSHSWGSCPSACCPHLCPACYPTCSPAPRTAATMCARQTTRY